MEIWWKTNDADLQKVLDMKEGVSPMEKKAGIKILGIPWNEKDEFVMNVESYFEHAERIVPTKRNILKTLASIFDIAGFLQPLTIKLKLLFQSICASGIGWDENISVDMVERWWKIIKEFRNVRELVVSRCYCLVDLKNPIVRTQLHGFSDASKLCYASCVYFKFVKRNGDVRISLVAAKSRLAPTKNKSIESKQTVPRMELMGNLLLSKLVVNIKEAVKEEMTIDETYCWSDSMVSLAWINAREKEFKTFVQNRVISIRNNVSEDHWRHCRSEDNAADVLTKDKSTIDWKAWIHGPEFLYNSCDVERVERTLEPREFSKEIKDVKGSMALKVSQTSYLIGNIININHYNDLLKLLRVTALVIRYVHNLKAKVLKKKLTLHKHV